MISKEDCVAMCGLEPDEVEAIAEHEHTSEVIAAAVGSYLLKCADGPVHIREMIIEDIHKALEDGRVVHASQLFAALQHFVAVHPEARAGLTAR